MKDFDEHVTSKIYGYKSVDSYYRHFSPVNRIRNITVIGNLFYNYVGPVFMYFCKRWWSLSYKESL
jgi:predicted alpha/beta-fold hydrolase